jgi:HEAT repeat protein
MPDLFASPPPRASTPRVITPATFRAKTAHRSALLLGIAILAASSLAPSTARTMAQTAPQNTTKSPNNTSAPDSGPGNAQNTPQDDTDTPPVREPGTATVAENIATAWSLLTTAVTDAKHPQRRIQALAAIGTLGASPRAEKMLTTALRDPDLDVRTAAVLAAGQSKDRNLIVPLRHMLDDTEPQVAFTAATTLWKEDDHSGEDILRAVVDGERKTNAGLMNGAMHSVNEDLHSPGTLARIGALQGASLLLGPFGFGITAYEYIHKNGGDSTRVLAVNQIAQERNASIRKELVAALGDKDPAVRAAAARALGSYREKEVSDALANLFYDPKLPVRLTAAAAYLRSNHAAPGVPESKRRDDRELPFPSTK